jgi:rod shape determining protein RodA
MTTLLAPATLSATPTRRRLDWVLLAAVTGLLVLSTLLVWSATVHRTELVGADSAAFARKQLVNIVIGLALMAAVAGLDQRRLRGLVPMLYLGTIGGLVLVLVAGTTINGSRSWLRVGGLSLQPSEFAKLALVLAVAALLAARARATGRARVGSAEVVLVLAVAAVPLVLTLAQPDLGTTLVLAATTYGVVAAAGAGRRWLLLLAGGAIGGAVAATSAGVLKAYQVDRFLAFVDPSLDPRGAGYNTEQARVAIGNGGLTGQGLFDGSQTTAGFVPEQHTDFIFTVAGEELGLVGAAALVGLLAVVVWRALAISRACPDAFGRVAAAGIACWIGVQGFWNVGMCLGIMPVTGIPLPFVSYGGSSLFASLLAVGLLLNLRLRTARRMPYAASEQGRVLMAPTDR